MIVQNTLGDGKTDFTFTVHRDDYDQATKLLNVVCEKLQANSVQGNNEIAKVSIVGVGMWNHPGVAQKMFETLVHLDIACILNKGFTQCVCVIFFVELFT